MDLIMRRLTDAINYFPKLFDEGGTAQRPGWRRTDATASRVPRSPIQY
jgi:hypothetical protein